MHSTHSTHIRCSWTKRDVFVLRRPKLRHALGNIQAARQAVSQPKSAIQLHQEEPVPSVDSLRTLRVVDLQARLKELGLPKSGVKEELILRLHTALAGQQGPPTTHTASRGKPNGTEAADGILHASTSGPVGRHSPHQADAVVASTEENTSEHVQATLPEEITPGRARTRQRKGQRSNTDGEAKHQEPPAPAPEVVQQVPQISPPSPQQRQPKASAQIDSGSGDRQPAAPGKEAARLRKEALDRILRQTSGSTASTSAASASPGLGKASTRAQPVVPARSPARDRGSQTASAPVAQPAPVATPLPPVPMPDRFANGRPTTGHPQAPKKTTWAGHRPPRYWAVGRATEVPFAEASAPSSIHPQPHRDAYPLVVDSRGKLVEVSEVPVSDWPAQPLPEDLPPAPPGFRKESYGSHELQMGFEDKEQFALSNASGLNLSFLGTGHHQAMIHRAHPSVTLNRAKDVIVFDAGDDTQRQVGQLSAVRLGKVFRIFITTLSQDCILGLPGILCCISASRERGHETTDIPVHLYGPPGLTEFVDTALKVSNTYIEVTIVVHEFTMSMVPQEQREPVLVNPRARLWSVLMPPDQLNPEGFIDGDLATFMPAQGRATINKGTSSRGGVLGHDSRANFLPLPDPVPGDPLRDDVSPLDMRWTIRMDCEGMITATPLKAPRPTLGYIFREADRAGNLMLDRAEALGVPKGSTYGMLKEGKSIVTPSGRLVTPELVVTPRRLGRKVVFLGTCSDASVLLGQPEAACPDVLVAGCVRPDQPPLHDEVEHLMQARALGDVAAKLSARHVLLSRFDWRLHGMQAHPYDDPVLEDIVQQTAARLSPQQRVSAVHDLWLHVVDKHEGVEFGPASS